MNWEDFKALVYTFLYLDAAAIHWYKLGKSELEAFLILCLICIIGLILTFKLFDFVFILFGRISNKVKEISGEPQWRWLGYFWRYLRRFYQRFVENPRAKLIKKFIEILAKQRYFLFFICNAIPTAPLLTAATIGAAKLTKSKYAFWVILAGNVLKVYIMVTVTYRIGSLF